MKNKLRILQLVNVRWWNASAEYGVYLALGLHRRGHRVIVMGRHDSPPLRRAEALGLSVQATEMGTGRPGGFLASLRELVRLIRRERIQVINAHRGEGHLYAALASRMVADRVAVFRTRGDVRPPKGHLLNRYLHRRLTDGVILAAEILRGPVLKNLGLPPKCIRVIPPGVEPHWFPGRLSPQEARRSLGWPEEDPVVGIVGRLSPVKGHQVFLEAAGLVLASCPRARFVIVGREAQIKVAQLREQAERLGIAHRVRFTGSVPRVSSLVAAFDVAVVASTGSEVICRVALEHMAMARPVVGTRVNAVPEVVLDGSTGLLVPPKDPTAMSQAIVSLLLDARRAESLGQAGRRRVRDEFTLDHLAHRTEGFYRELLGTFREGS